MSARTVRTCIVASILASFVQAGAEPAGNIDLNAFRPAMDSRGYLTVNASQVLGDKEISFGLGALALGVTGFLIVSLTARQLWATPDWRVSVPFLIATTAAAAMSFVRRERAVALPLLGVGLAAAAVVLGWFLVTAIVVGVTTIVILALSHAL